MAPENYTEAVLPAADVARMLGLSRHTLMRMRRRPQAAGLPFVKLSEGRLGYRRTDVEAFLRARRVGALPEAPAT